MNATAWALLIALCFSLLGQVGLGQEPALCRGDCNASGEVAINELITGVAIATGTRPITACVDLDGDGDTEISISELIQAVNSSLGGCVAPDPLFEVSDIVCVGEQPEWVVAQDINQDEVVDLVVANRSSNDVSVLLGAGNGSFSAETRYPTGASPRAAASADLDGDLRAELPDIDGDGFADVITANRDDRNVSVLINQGDGTFVAEPTVELADSRPHAVAAADFDGDGVLEIAVSSAAPDDGEILLRAGTEQQASVAAGVEPRDMAVVDFDGDQVLDLVVGNLDSDDVSILTGIGDGEFTLGVTVGVGEEPRRLGVGDIDGDGFPEIATANEAADSVSVVRNDSGTARAEADQYETGNNPQAVEFGDINGDEFADLVIVERADSRLRILLGTASGLLALRQTIQLPEADCSGELLPPRPRGVSIADIDGDGKADLATADSGSDSVTLLFQR